MAQGQNTEPPQELNSIEPLKVLFTHYQAVTYDSCSFSLLIKIILSLLLEPCDLQFSVHG